MASRRNVWIRMLAVRFLILCASGSVWLSASCGIAQVDAILPSIPMGDATVRLRAISTGLPVELEFITPVFTQRVGPTDLDAVPGTGGGHVVTTYGGVAFFVDRAGDRAAEPFIDLISANSDSFNSNFEVGGAHGLTSIAFHPDFADSSAAGYLRFYTLEAEVKFAGSADYDDSFVPGDHHQEALYEYQLGSVDAQRCDVSCVSTKREVLRVNQPSWHHNLGDLLFEEDGLLFVSSGDSGVAGTTPPIRSDHSLDLSTIYGKVLRIDPLGSNSTNGQYGIPSDNPFVDGAGPNIDEIYAYGLRNPYRIARDSITGQLYASETGELHIESVEAISKGTNHGWNDKEGSWIYDKTTRGVSPDVDGDGDGLGDLAQARGYTEPLFEYGRQDGIAVTGVAVSESPLLPELDGNVVFSDFEGRLFYGDPESGDAFALQIDAAGESTPFRIHSVNQGSDGAVYVLGINQIGEEFDGGVYRLESTPATDGDVDGNGILDAQDIDLIAANLRQGVPHWRTDINDDGQVNIDDHAVWVSEIKRTYLGDADLDGEFNSSDLVAVFQTNQYEDGLTGNSTWATGDWNGDSEFTTADLVAAFQPGSYETGPRPATFVPEPVTMNLAVFIAVGATRRRRLF